MSETGKKERVIVDPAWPDHWTCICGNTPMHDGFYPCNADGNEMEPVEGWEDLYVCLQCGRIIHQDTLEVVGRNPHPKLLE